MRIARDDVDKLGLYFSGISQGGKNRRPHLLLLIRYLIEAFDWDHRLQRIENCCIDGRVRKAVVIQGKTFVNVDFSQLEGAENIHFLECRFIACLFRRDIEIQKTNCSFQEKEAQVDSLGSLPCQSNEKFEIDSLSSLSNVFGKPFAVRLFDCPHSTFSQPSLHSNSYANAESSDWLESNSNEETLILHPDAPMQLPTFGVQ